MSTSKTLRKKGSLLRTEGSSSSGKHLWRMSWRTRNQKITIRAPTFTQTLWSPSPMRTLSWIPCSWRPFPPNSGVMRRRRWKLKRKDFAQKIWWIPWSTQLPWLASCMGHPSFSKQCWVTNEDNCHPLDLSFNMLSSFYISLLCPGFHSPNSHKTEREQVRFS